MKKQLLFKGKGKLSRYCCLLVSALFPGLIFAQAPSESWTSQFGGDGMETVSSWVKTTDGGYLIGGTSSSGATGQKTDPSYGGKDYWIVKLDASGSKTWDKSYGGSADDELAIILKTSDGGYLLAGTSNSPISGTKADSALWGTKDYWLVKINSSGTEVWDKRFGGGQEDILSSAVENSDGSFLIGGSSKSRTSADRTVQNRTNPAPPLIPPTDYWVVKVSSTGSKLWDNAYGGSGDATLVNRNGFDELKGIVKTSDGGYLLAGHSNSNSGSEKTDNAYDDGNNPTVTNPDYWVIKINSSGAKQWDKVYGGNEAEKLYEIKATDTTDQFLLVGSSRSGNTGNKSNSPANLSSDVAEHVWTVKINAAGSNQGNILFSRTYEGRPAVRNYFDNISAATNTNGYTLYLNAKDKDGKTKRIDSYNWLGAKQWSKSMADTSHYQSNRKLYQVLNTSFDTLQLEPQTRKLYTAFLNAWDTKELAPNFYTGYLGEYYANTVDLYGMRGSKNFQNNIKQFLEEGISDPRLIQILYEQVEPIATRFERANKLWPAGKPLPGATIRLANGNIKVVDEFAKPQSAGGDRDKEYTQAQWDNLDPAPGKLNSKARRIVWAGSGVANTHPWGNNIANITVNQRKSSSYKSEESTNTSNRRRFLYIAESTQAGGLTSYGTQDHRLDFQLGSEYILWAGYILDVNRHLNSNYGAIADSIWAYKADWEIDANRILGNRENSAEKIFPDAHALHHANVALTSVYHCFVEWEKLRNGTPRAKDVSALQFQIETLLNDFKPIAVPGTAPENDKYVGAYIQNYSHFNNPTLDKQGKDNKNGPGDTTYEIEFSPILANLKKARLADASGNLITDTTFEAMSNLHALIIEQTEAKSPIKNQQGQITGYKWAIPGNVVHLKGGGSSAKMNNDVTFGGVYYGGTSGVDWETTGARRPNGGTYLSYDKTGRQLRLFALRGKSHDGSLERFNVANVLANPNHTDKRSWHWLQVYLLLKLRKPDVNLLDIDNFNIPLNLSNSQNRSYVFLSDSGNYVVLNSVNESSVNDDFEIIAYGTETQIPLIDTLETEDATRYNVSVQSNGSNWTHTGYGRYDDDNGGYIEWGINSASGASVLLKFRYANGTIGGGFDRPLQLKVNGVAVDTLAFPPSGGGWSAWIYQNAVASLQAGNNTIRLTTIGTVGPNIDNLAFEPYAVLTDTLEAEEAAFSGVTVKNTNPGYTHTGYNRYDNNNGGYTEWTIDHHEGGSTLLKFRYANGTISGGFDRPLQLKVNGIAVDTLAFPTSGGDWWTWIYQNATVNLSPGTNTIRLTTIGTVGPNVDNLSYEPAGSGLLMTAPLEKSILNEAESIHKNDLQLMVYPNPVSDGVVHLNIKNALEGAANIQLINLSGVVLRSLSKTLINGDNHQTIDTSGIAPGVYSIRFRQHTKILSAKLIIR